MPAIWDLPDFDNHEVVHFVTDEKSGLKAVIAVHSSALGPGAGGTRFWPYLDHQAAITDALRLSRGMSYKNALAGLPLGGGKGVILAPADRRKTSEMIAAYARAIEQLGGLYVTAEDVGINEADMSAIAKVTRHVSGLPGTSGAAGGDPGPFTAKGVFLGIKAAVRHRLGKQDMAGVHVAIQGVGSVGGGVARLLAQHGARLTIADIDKSRVEQIATETGAAIADLDKIAEIEADVFSPNSLGAILNERSIARLNVPIVAGGANNQLAGPADGKRLMAREILYAPDYVINAGGIINVGLEYLEQAPVEQVWSKIDEIPGRLDQIWQESEADAVPPAQVADHMAQRLIGRA